MTGTETETERTHCANCGTVMTGEFCPACGQSRKSIERSFLALAGEALGDILQWDGRFMTTYRKLFSRPGRVARDYADGKRQSYTPPVRLYLVISLIFFALVTGSGIRIVSIEFSLDAQNDIGLASSLFQAPRDAPAETLPQDVQDSALARAAEAGWSQTLINIGRRAMASPEAIEQQASAIAGQAMIAMVICFALLNAAFHPRRRLIEHAIYGLYFHAALLLPFAVLILVGTFMPWPDWTLTIGDQPVPFAIIGGITLAALAVIGFGLGIVLSDRGFYGSSWIGACLRGIGLAFTYIITATLISLSLLFFAAL